MIFTKTKPQQTETIMTASAPGVTRQIKFELIKEGDEYNFYQDSQFVYGSKDKDYAESFFLWTVSDYDGMVG